jgi:hypothetical protein
LAEDRIGLSSREACFRGVCFAAPGGIEYGNDHFAVKSADSIVKVPLEITTTAHAEELEKE